MKKVRIKYIQVSSKADSRTVYQCQETINKIMNASSINRKGEVLKMLLKVSDLSESKSILCFKFKDYSKIFDVDDKL